MEQQDQAGMVQLPMTPEATSAAVAAHYAADADFRAEFDKDPKTALAQIGGEELPSGLEIVVHRNENKCWHIALPARQTAGALDDRDIENVSGGLTHSGPVYGSILGGVLTRLIERTGAYGSGQGQP